MSSFLPGLNILASVAASFLQSTSATSHIYFFFQLKAGRLPHDLGSWLSCWSLKVHQGNAIIPMNLEDNIGLLTPETTLLCITGLIIPQWHLHADYQPAQNDKHDQALESF